MLVIRSNPVVFKLGIAVNQLSHDRSGFERLLDHYEPSVPAGLPRNADDFASKPFELVIVSQSTQIDGKVI